MYIVVVAGNIGAGKSTTLDALSQLLGHHQVCYVMEPVEEWREQGFLEEFYKTGNAFEFQLRVLYSRVAAYERALAAFKAAHNNEDPVVVVLDRWFFEDREFARVNLLRGAMTEKQFALYETAYSYLIQHYPQPKLSLWLDVSPEQCLARLQQRGRPEELAGITLEYLQQLNSVRDQYTNLIPVENQTPLEVALCITKYLIKSEYVDRYFKH
jgi:deoxyadenosine/deoxycytidine kinase